MSNKFFELLMNSIFANCLYGTGDRSSSCLMRPISVSGQRGELGSNLIQEPKSVAAAHSLRSGVGERSSAAKKAEAVFKISFALRSSLFSCRRRFSSSSTDSPVLR